MNRRCCLCQVCCNVALKVEAVNKLLCGRHDHKHISKRETADMTVCAYDGQDNGLP